MNGSYRSAYSTCLAQDECAALRGGSGGDDLPVALVGRRIVHCIPIEAAMLAKVACKEFICVVTF